MDELDMRGARPGIVRIGIARVTRLDRAYGVDGDAMLPATLESIHGEVAARTPGRLVARAGVTEGDLIVACGVVEWLRENLILDLQMVRRVESQGATALSVWEVGPDEEIRVEMPVPMAAYCLRLIARDLSRWAPGRRSRLTRDEVAGFGLYLHDRLPAGFRTPLPSGPSKRRVA